MRDEREPGLKFLAGVVTPERRWVLTLRPGDNRRNAGKRQTRDP